MLRRVLKGRTAALAAMLVVVATSISGYVVRNSRAAGNTITVSGGSTAQTITALGADINPNSWDNGNLKPALDMLIDQEGMKTFRVGMDMIDWESTNDDSDPNNFNWTYYDPIYSGQTTFDTAQAGSNFANTWAVIDYLHQKGIPDNQIELSFMGDGPQWMGRANLTAGKEDEFVEEVLSAAYYGYTHGHTFGLFSPDNEEDIGGSNEGVGMSDTQYADVMNRLATRMNALGMSGVRLVGPETCCNVGYAGTILDGSYPAFVGKLDHFDFHNYGGGDNGAAAAIAGSGKDFWISEYNNWDQTFDYLNAGASGLMMWEAYDSVYNHAIVNGHGSQPGNDSLSFGDTPLLAYNKTTKTYTPRSIFYDYEMLFKWISIGSVRIGASSSNGNIQAEAFKDPVSGRVTILGDSNLSSATTITVNLSNVPATTSYDVYQTDTSGDQATKTGTATVSGNSFTFSITAGSEFTVTSTGSSPTPTPTPSATPSPTPTPAATPSPGGLVGDINGDGKVNIFDLSTLLSSWGGSNAACDLNHDGTVNVFDLSTLLTHWTG